MLFERITVFCFFASYAVALIAEAALLLRPRPILRLIGTSFGGAVAVYAAGIDLRIAAVISNGGWGNGERKFRGQHPTPEAWARFTAMLAEGREHSERTGRSLMVPRCDIVPIPKRLREDLAGRAVQMFPAGTIETFPAETACSIFAPTTWSIGSRRDRSCSCTARTTR